MDEALDQAHRTARAIARSRNKLKDSAWIDEAEAEAYFIVTELILTSHTEIVEKYPDYDERFRFYRMSVGYGLKAYFAYRALSTLSYLKSKGIDPKHISFEDGYVMVTDHSALVNLAMEDCAKTGMERQVLQFYLMANDWECISHKVGLSVKRVKKVMRRIKRRLKDDQASVHDGRTSENRQIDMECEAEAPNRESGFNQARDSRHALSAQA